MDLNHVTLIIVQLYQIEQHEQLELIIKTIDHEIHIVILHLECEIVFTGIVQLYEAPQYQILMYCGDDYEM